MVPFVIPRLGDVWDVVSIQCIDEGDIRKRPCVGVLDSIDCVL